MSGELHYEELIEDTKELAKEEGVDLDSVNCYHDHQTMGHVIQMKKRARIEGSTEELGGEVVINHAKIHDSNIDHIQLIKRQIRQIAQNMREKISRHIECNEHKLVFYMEDGFHAFDKVTGEEWSVQPEDIEHTTPMTMPPKDEDSALSQCVDFGSSEQEIPFHIKEKMMMWVVGWALEYSPREWMNQKQGLYHV